MDHTRTIFVATSDNALPDALRQRGWTVQACKDGHTLLASARRAAPHAILIDGGLQGGGLGALKALRYSVHSAHVPVVAVANAAQCEDYLGAGAQEVLAAPADAAAIDTALRRHAAPLPVARAPAPVIEDPVRLAALRASGLLDSPTSVAFDQVTRLVTGLLQAPTGLLSLVDKDRQFFKSHVGLGKPYSDTRQTPLSHSFCQWVVSGREQIAIQDAREHPALKSNLAIRDLGVIAYSGVPVSGPEGQVLGSLCAIDGQPRAWSESQLEVLQDLAELAEATIAHDQVVKSPPRHAAEFDRYVAAAGEAVNAATRLLRLPGLRDEERELLLLGIERHAAHLVQLNRLIQVSLSLA